jgi:hypothetical protein
MSAREKRRIKNHYAPTHYSPLDNFSPSESSRKSEYHLNDSSIIPEIGRQRGKSDKTSLRQKQSDTFSNIFGVGSSRRENNYAEKSVSRLKGNPEDIYGEIKLARSNRVSSKSRGSSAIDGHVMKSGFESDREGYSGKEDDRLVDSTLARLRNLDMKPTRIPSPTSTHKPRPPPILTAPGVNSYSRRRASQVTKTPSTERLHASSISTESSPVYRSSLKSPRLPVMSLARQLSKTSIDKATEKKEIKSPVSARPRSKKAAGIHPEIKALLKRDFLSLPEGFFERPGTGGQRNKSTFSNLGNTVRPKFSNISVL